jgi:predicted TIM-barrel fold metal-dependent hydrolase
MESSAVQGAVSLGARGRPAMSPMRSSEFMVSTALSRRRLLVGTIASAATLRLGVPPLAAAPQPRVPVDFKMPLCACDTHAHVFGDPGRFPFSPTRTYTPPPAPTSELIKLHEALGIQRSVIVTASAYGTDNSATLDAVRLMSPHACGIVVTDEHTSDEELDSMERSGVRGVRLFLTNAGQKPDEARQWFDLALRQVEGRSWHVQIFANLALIGSLKDLFMRSPVPVVFDHFGGARGELGPSQPGFEALTELVGSGRAYVKLSAAYRLSKRAPAFEDMAPLARTLIAANRDRILWASDWPHTDGEIPGKKPTDLFPFIPVDDAQLLNLFASWVPDAALRKHILVDNPSRLYRFTDS